MVLGAFAFAGLTAFLTPETAFAQQSGINRTNLQRHDISVSGYETIQTGIDFEAHSALGMRNHPGEELMYVLEGTIEYQIEGEKPIILKAGDVLFVPAGKNHSAKNAGHVRASELATYIVEKNKPLLVLKNN